VRGVGIFREELGLAGKSWNAAINKSDEGEGGGGEEELFEVWSRLQCIFNARRGVALKSEPA